MNEYKGVFYDVIYVKGATADQRYIAKSCDGSYSAHGATEDEAKNHFMIKIDQIPVHREINNMPLSDTDGSHS